MQFSFTKRADSSSEIDTALAAIHAEDTDIGAEQKRQIMKARHALADVASEHHTPHAYELQLDELISDTLPEGNAGFTLRINYWPSAPASPAEVVDNQQAA